MAGVMIAIGGTVFLMTRSKELGAVLFAIGLFAIVVNGLNLFTGQVGYIVNYSNAYLIRVLVTLVGNFIGTVFMGSILLMTRLSSSLTMKAEEMIKAKLADSFVSIFILAFFCGILMYLAVNGYRTINDPVGKYLAVFLGVAVFILAGFEHCVANMYYFAIAKAWSWQAVCYMEIMILGNAAGAVAFSFCEKIYKQQKPQNR